MPTIFMLALVHHSTSLASPGHQESPRSLERLMCTEQLRELWEIFSPLFFQEHSGKRWTHKGESWTKGEGLEHPGRELGTQGEQNPQHCWAPPASLRPSQLPGRAVRAQNYLSMLRDLY